MTDTQTTPAPGGKTKVKLEPPVHNRTEDPRFIDENGREFYMECAGIGYWLVKSPDIGAIPQALEGYFTNKDIGEETLTRYILSTDKTGKAFIKRD